MTPSNIESASGPTNNGQPTQPHTIHTQTEIYFITLLVSTAATFSGFASNIYFPSLPTISNDLSVSLELVNLTVTSYLIFQGLTPTLWGAVSDALGRRVTYLATLIVFIGACIGLAETGSYAQLIVLRCVQSTGSASTIAIGAGVIGDLTTRETRGGLMGFFQAGLLLPVAFGPVIGGALSHVFGWRGSFWFLAAYSGMILLVIAAVLPETLRSMVSDGSISPPTFAKSLLQRVAGTPEKPKVEGITDECSTQQVKPKIDFLASIRILWQIQAVLPIVFVGVYYAVWQMTLTILPSLFKETYDLPDARVGLVYIANGVGCIVGTMTTGKILDGDYRRFRARYPVEDETKFPLERARLRTVWIFAPVQVCMVLAFGWMVERGVHIAGPIVCLFFVGWAAVSIQSIVSTLLVDLYPKQSASATASLNLVRCLLAAGGTAAVGPCIGAMGTDWTFTLLSSVLLCFMSVLVVQMRLGARWRKGIN